MRLVFAAGFLSVLAAATTLACSSADKSGSTESDVQSADAGSSQAPRQTPVSDPAPPTMNLDGGLDLSDATVITTQGDAGVLCDGDSIREAEPNNSAPNAIPAQSGSFCGRLDPGDVDVLTLTMPQQGGTFDFSIDRTGPFRMDASVNGQPFDPRGWWPVGPGETVTLTLSSRNSMAPVDYKFSFSFD